MQFKEYQQHILKKHVVGDEILPREAYADARLTSNKKGSVSFVYSACSQRRMTSERSGDLSLTLAVQGSPCSRANVSPELKLNRWMPMTWRKFKKPFVVFSFAWVSGFHRYISPHWTQDFFSLEHVPEWFLHSAVTLCRVGTGKWRSKRGPPGMGTVTHVWAALVHCTWPKRRTRNGQYCTFSHLRVG